jgi:hypothetical protein
MNESNIRRKKWPDLYGTAACPDVNGALKRRSSAGGNRAPTGKFTRVLSKRDHAALAAKKASIAKMMQDAERPAGAR